MEEVEEGRKEGKSKVGMLFCRGGKRGMKMKKSRG